MGGARLNEEQKVELLSKLRKPTLRGKVRPYIALGFIGKDAIRDGEKSLDNKKRKRRFRPRPSCMVLIIDGCHKAPSSVVNYTNKGYEILDYYVPERPEDPNKDDEYARMRAHLAQKDINAESFKAKDRKISQLEKDLEKAKEELKIKKIANKGKKDE